MVNVTFLVHNRPRLTQQCLSSLGSMENASVTVLNHRSDDETSAIVDLFCLGREGWFGAWSDDDIGTGPLRNLVIAKSESRFGRGDHLYVGDNDCFFLQADWLKVLTAAYDEAKQHGFKVLGAYNHPYNRPMNPRRLDGCRSTVSEVYALASQSMLMNWDVWDEFGPFCDTPAGKVCQSEDVAFSNKIRAAGFKVGVISPSLLVNTGITNSFGEKIPGWDMVLNECPEGVICE